MADSTAPTEVTTAAGRYSQLEAYREPYLARAREVAALTLPALMPPGEQIAVGSLVIPWQSLGSRGVNHLAAKLLLALFPPGSSFFRLTLDDFVLAELQQKEGENFEKARADFEEALNKVEKAVCNRLEQKGHRTTLFEVLRQLIVCGNVVIETLDGGGIRYHKLDRYVCKRDRSGNVIDLVIKETVAPITLPEHVRAIIEKYAQEHPDEKEAVEKSVDIYTRVVRKADKWEVHQEVCGEIIPESQGSYPLDKSGFIVLRWAKLDGEDYGLGHVNDYLGDLKSVEALERAMTQFAGVASKIVFMVRENGITSIKKLVEAPSGAVLEGDAEDVTIVGLDGKVQDFGVIEVVNDKKVRRLEQAFLLASGVTRDAERVTAEEIRALINELEQALGGVYSILAQELQTPLVRRIMLQMQKEKALPHLPESSVQAQIVTGVEALGRTSDLMRLDSLLAGVNEMFGPEAVAKHIDISDYLKRKATALSLDAKGLVRSAEEVQKIEQTQTQQQMTEKLGPAVMKAGTEIGLAQNPA